VTPGAGAKGIIPWLEALIGAVLLLLSAPLPAASSCRIVPWTGDAGHSITVADLMALVDIMSISLSPDGKHVAMLMTQAQVGPNRECEGWYLLSEDTGFASARFMGDGGDLRLGYSRQLPQVTGQGVRNYSTAIWAEDGRSFFYLRQDGKSVQVWRSMIADGRQEQLTQSKFPIERFWVDRRSRQLIAEVVPERWRPNWTPSEERSGFLFDDRFNPPLSRSPMLRAADLAIETKVHDLTTARERAASPKEIAQFHAALEEVPSDVVEMTGGRPAGGMVATPRQGGTVARLEPVDAHAYQPDLHPTVTNADGGRVRCSNPRCTGALQGLWWGRDGQELLFLKRDGPNLEQWVVDGWKPDSGDVREILRTNDEIIGCWSHAKGSLCLEEGSLQPRRLVRLNEQSGKRTPVFDPNKGFASRFRGSVMRLHWSTKEAGPAFGDLVLPPGHRPGKRHPLLVLPYNSTGLLRAHLGGVYPILPLAERGIAVLQIDTGKDFQRPIFHKSGEGDVIAARAASGNQLWFEVYRLGVESADGGIKTVEALGIIDSKHIAAAGQSYGGQVINYWLIQEPSRFAAVISSGFSWDPVDYYVGIDRHYQQVFAAIGLTNPQDPNALARWAINSAALGAHRIDVPWLMNAPDSEFYTVLQNFQNQRDLGHATELYVLKDDFHYLVQPAHLTAVSARNLDWLAFWLLGMEDPRPDKRAQYVRWEAMRDAWASRRRAAVH
jgi:hypothetical protein